MRSDTDIWNDLRAGDQKALKLIYTNHIEALLQYGKRFIRNEQELEDAVHDLFVQLWTRRGHLGETDSIIKYLLVSLKRSLFKVNKANLKVVGSENLESTSFEGELSIEDMIIKGEAADEKKARLKKAFSELSAKQREAIYLRYEQDTDYETIAEIMEISYQSVRNLVSKGIIRMRDALKLILLLWALFLEQ